jgi:hypothetical protein
VIRYVAADDSVFNLPQSNPRAWTYVARFLKERDRGKISRQTLATIVSGLVGSERALSFFGFLQSGERPLEADEVLDDYAAHRDRLVGWVEGGRLDSVESSLVAVLARLQAKVRFEEVRQDPQAWRNLGHFLEDLSGDQRVKAEEFFREHDYEYPAATSATSSSRRRKSR